MKTTELFHTVQAEKCGEIFSISKENCATVRNAFYGYILTEDSFYLRQIPEGYICDPYAHGAWIQIRREGDEIIISQDCFGSYGLFVYRKGSDWAISNSLFYLASEIAARKEVRLSLNEGFAALSLFPALSHLAFSSTCYNEISQVRPNAEIRINLRTEELNIIEIPLKLCNVPLFSQEAASIIDSWHSKFNSFLLSVLLHGQKVNFQLSGGMDSRNCFAAMKDTLLRFRDQVFIGSISSMSSQLAIATKIASLAGLNVNKGNISINGDKLSCEERFMYYLFSKAPFSFQGYYTEQVNQEYLFLFTGLGGEILKDFGAKGMEQFINHTIYNKPQCYNAFKETASNLLTDEYSQIDREYPYHIPPNSKLFMFTRWRHHSKKNNYELFFNNVIIISPLYDWNLYRINVFQEADANALRAVMYERYFPGILDIGFDGGRELTDTAKEIARRFNSMYPFKAREIAPLENFKLAPIKSHETNITDSGNIKEYIRSMMTDPEVKQYLIDNYGSEIYADRYAAGCAGRPYAEEGWLHILCKYIAADISGCL